MVRKFLILLGVLLLVFVGSAPATNCHGTETPTFRCAGRNCPQFYECELTAVTFEGVDEDGDGEDDIFLLCRCNVQLPPSWP